MKKILLIVVMFLLTASFGYSEETQNEANKIDLVIFHGQGCSHCAQMLNFLDGMKEKYPELNVIEYEIYSHKENVAIFQEMVELYNTEIKGVPTIFINEKSIAGYSKVLAEEIEKAIKSCIEKDCLSPIERYEKHIKVGEEGINIEGDKSPTEDPSSSGNKLTIGAVIGAAVIDAINPCAFAVLILLMTTILASGNKKRSLFAGLAFSASVFISYFLMGIGLFSAVQASGATSIFYTVVAILAIILGLFNLKDYLWYGKWFIMEVPISWRPKMKALLRGVTSVPGAFLVGFLVSLFLLPCTSGPYIVILGLLAKQTTQNHAIMLLLLYNFIFILPMIIITTALFFGLTTTERAERWRTRKLKVLHLIAGILMILLGAGMLVGMHFGFI